MRNMDDGEFLITFPLYMVVCKADEPVPLALSGEHDGEKVRGVAFFTEELLVERMRNRLGVDSEAWRIETPLRLTEVYLPLCKEAGYGYIAIDPHDETAECIMLPIDGIEV